MDFALTVPLGNSLDITLELLKENPLVSEIFPTPSVRESILGADINFYVLPNQGADVSSALVTKGLSTEGITIADDTLAATVKILPADLSMRGRFWALAEIKWMPNLRSSIEGFFEVT